MLRILLSAFILSAIFVYAFNVAAQAQITIGAKNLSRLKPVARIDFADFPGELEIGWFEANHDASEFIVFDKSGRLYRVGAAGIESSFSHHDNGQIFSLIDAAYLADVPIILYLLDDNYFINEQQLDIDLTPVALVAVAESLFVESTDGAGSTLFLQYVKDEVTEGLRLIDSTPLPETDPNAPAVRIGRIDFPLVIISSLAESALNVYRYPDAFAAGSAIEIELDDGPAVFGAVNRAGSHLAWSDPQSARLNLLDLANGENRVAADLGGAYAQYHLLTADASAILIVNLNFAPAVFAWDVDTGERFDLGAYRDCERIPDKVALSADGAALIIGCDTGLEIWRIVPEEEE